jgi:DNA mismatch repair protein MutS2
VLARHLHVLELPKILERLAGYCAFSASADLARALEPATEPSEVVRRLAETREARALLKKQEHISVGNARDVREAVRLAARGGMLEPHTLLAIRDTLLSGRTIQRALARFGAIYPQLTAITNTIEPSGALIAEINRCLDDAGQVRDTASPELAAIRREARLVHDRLLAKLQRLINDVSVAPYLQEPIITQRSGRYVIPIKADFKGRVQGLVHDQSASGLTLFIEPLATLELNNEWRELQLAEERELRRVLLALSGLVGAEANNIIRTVEALAQFDLALAKAKYAEAIQASEPTIISSSTDDAPHTLHIVQARHPLIDPQKVVPIDIALDGARVLVITGPNTGGKTVALKTVGLLVLMAQCGLHLPCAAATLPAFEAVYADIGDEQSIEQSLSTFSAHMNNLCAFLDRIGPRTLVLLDELGAGTDPAEGAVLARALLEYILRSGALCLVATHYPELKAWAALTEGAVNANVAFDEETLCPLYKLTIGLPGRSNAFAIAQRLGLPGEIITAARAYLNRDLMQAEELLGEVNRLYQQAERAREAAAAAQQMAEADAERLRSRLSAIEEERQAILQQAREEALRETEALRAEIRQLRQRLLAIGSGLEEAKRLEQETEQLAARAMAALPKPRAADPHAGHAIRAGDTVRVKSLGVSAQVSAIFGDEADVQAGRARLRVKLSDLQRVADGSCVANRREDSSIAPAPREWLPMELDVRGLTADEGVARVRHYLDRAVRAGLPFVRLIHGKGSGALRRAIRDAIKHDPAVQSFEAGLDSEGGDGVTVVKLKQR